MVGLRKPASSPSSSKKSWHRFGIDLASPIIFSILGRAQDIQLQGLKCYQPIHDQEDMSECYIQYTLSPIRYLIRCFISPSLLSPVSYPYLLTLRLITPTLCFTLLSSYLLMLHSASTCLILLHALSPISNPWYLMVLLSPYYLRSSI